jgi:SH3-like domain-containing protein
MKKLAIISSIFLFLTTYALSAPRFVETIRNANIRSGPSTRSTLVAASKKGDIFQLIKETDKWYIVRMFSGDTRYIFKSLARVTTYTPAMPDTIEERRDIFRGWIEADKTAQADADRRYPPNKNLKRNLNYLHLQADRKKLEITHKYRLQPPDLRRIVLEGNFKGW